MQRRVFKSVLQKLERSALKNMPEKKFVGAIGKEIK
jgi:hypothetical protein